MFLFARASLQRFLIFRRKNGISTKTSSLLTGFCSLRVFERTTFLNEFLTWNVCTKLWVQRTRCPSKRFGIGIFQNILFWKKLRFSANPLDIEFKIILFSLQINLYYNLKISVNRSSKLTKFTNVVVMI